MYGELFFSVRRPEKIIDALKTIYPSHDLETTRNSSQFKNFPGNMFVFGVTLTDVFLLIGIAGKDVTVSIDNPKNRSDLSQLRNRMDGHFLNISKSLKTHEIYPRNCRAVITVEQTEIAGTWPGMWSELLKEIRTNWLQIIVLPVLTLITIFFAFRFGWITDEQKADKMRDAYLATVPAVSIFIISLLAIPLRKREKKFNFTIQ